eukprot:scpid105630/ scgid11880/ 
MQGGDGRLHPASARHALLAFGLLFTVLCSVALGQTGDDRRTADTSSSSVENKSLLRAKTAYCDTLLNTIRMALCPGSLPQSLGSSGLRQLSTQDLLLLASLHKTSGVLDATMAEIVKRIGMQPVSTTELLCSLLSTTSLPPVEYTLLIGQLGRLLQTVTSITNTSECARRQP